MRPTTILATLALALSSQAAIYKRQTLIDRIDIDIDGGCHTICDLAEDTIEGYVDECYKDGDDLKESLTTLLPNDPTSQQYSCMCKPALFHRYRDCLDCYTRWGRHDNSDSDNLRSIADTMNRAIDKCNTDGNVTNQLQRLEFREPEGNGAVSLRLEPVLLVGLLPLLGLL